MHYLFYRRKCATTKQKVKYGYMHPPPQDNSIYYLPHLMVVPLPKCENHSRHCTESGIEHLVSSSLQHVPESSF